MYRKFSTGGEFIKEKHFLSETIPENYTAEMS